MALGDSAVGNLPSFGVLVTAEAGTTGLGAGVLVESGVFVCAFSGDIAKEAMARKWGNLGMER